MDVFILKIFFKWLKLLTLQLLHETSRNFHMHTYTLTHTFIYVKYMSNIQTCIHINMYNINYT